MAADIPKPPLFYSWRDVAKLELEEEEEYIEQGILSPGNVWLIFGPSASFKSMIAMNIAIDLSLGDKIFGSLDVKKPLRVLYIDKEVGLLWIKRRIVTMFPAGDIGEHLYLATKGQSPTEIELDNHRSIHPLMKAIGETGAEVLILDCLNPLMAQPESQEAYKGVEKTVNTITLKYPNLAVILIHHMREVREDMDALSIYNARDSTKLTDWAATRSPIRVVKKHLRDDSMSKKWIAQMEMRFVLRHGAEFTQKFWIDSNFRTVGKKPTVDLEDI